jgi:uncharacterized membrane protein
MRSRAAIGRHPIHPALVAVPIGAFALVAVGDLVTLFSGPAPFWLRFSRAALVAGLASAALAAVFGLIDYFTVRMSAAASRLATLHLVINLGALAAYALSLALRWGESGAELPTTPRAALLLALAAFVALGVSGWIGGKLTFEHKVGVVENADPEATAIGRTEPA